MFKTILVPVDAGEPSKKALTFALDLASSQKSDLRFCHVPVQSNARWDEVQKAGRAILDAARHRAQDVGVEAKTALRSGSPADAIAELAEHDGVDLIVMGNLNSAESVIRQAPVPVVFVGPNSNWDAGVADVKAYV